MALDEGEEIRRDINYLQKKIVTKYELQDMRDSIEAKLDTKMDSMKDQLDTKIDGLKGEIMEVLKNFIIEMTLESEMYPMKFMMRTQGR